MNHHYNDIVSRITEPPKWFDEAAVPRYCDFAPTETANIYANACVLMEIACQDCGTLFNVCMSETTMGLWRDALSLFDRDEKDKQKAWIETATLQARVKNDTIHYGDPPNSGCCAAGPTMNSVPIRIIEFWNRGFVKRYEWQRVPELEIQISPDWVGEVAHGDDS